MTARSARTRLEGTTEVDHLIFGTVFQKLKNKSVTSVTSEVYKFDHSRFKDFLITPPPQLMPLVPNYC